MKVTFHDHDGKGVRIAQALVDAGHLLVRDHGDVALVDHDIHRGIVDDHKVTILYPHGGNPILDWDGPPLHPNVRLNLTHGPGHAEIYALAALPVPTVPVGWCFSDLAPPRHPATVKRVLFGPSHPLLNGRRDTPREDLNHRILAALLDLDLDVTVRHWGDQSTTRFADGLPVTWSQGGHLGHDDIDAADLVIADCTLAHLAVARGAPTIWFGADIPNDQAHAGPPQLPARWDRYHDRMRYPYDWDDAPLADLIAAVTQPDERVAEWRRRFVGEPFDADLAVRLVETWAA